MGLSLDFPPCSTDLYFCVCVSSILPRASLVLQTAKNLPAMWETQVQSLGWEDTLEKGMVIHSSILAVSLWGPKESDMTEWLTLSLPPYCQTTDIYLFSHSSRVCMSKIKGLVGLISLEASLLGFQMAAWYPSQMIFSLCASTSLLLYLYLLLSSYKSTSWTGLRATPPFHLTQP